jgi:hypothetical protein
MIGTYLGKIVNGNIKLYDNAIMQEGKKVIVIVDNENLNELGFWNAAGQSSIEKIWNNTEDDIYEQLLEK